VKCEVVTAVSAEEPVLIQSSGVDREASTQRELESLGGRRGKGCCAAMLDQTSDLQTRCPVHLEGRIQVRDKYACAMEQGDRKSLSSR